MAASASKAALDTLSAKQPPCKPSQHTLERLTEYYNLNSATSVLINPIIIHTVAEIAFTMCMDS